MHFLLLFGGNTFLQSRNILLAFQHLHLRHGLYNTLFITDTVVIIQYVPTTMSQRTITGLDTQ
jgi:hypothetical protein